MEQILGFIKTYGLSVFVIATCIITFIGILKLCKIFNKITNKDVRKCIYYTLNVILAFAASAIYFAIFDINFSTYIVFSIAQLSATNALYAIYENFGVRKLVQMLLTWIASWFKSNPDNKFIKALKAMGLTEELITAELNKIKSQVAASQTTTEVKK